MKIVFLGTTKFSAELATCLVDNGIPIHTVVTTPESFTISYDSTGVKNYNYSDMGELSKSIGAHCINLDVNSGEKLSDHLEYFQNLKPDVILVMGWYFMVPRVIRETAQLGAWGIHASLLPNYAGGAPLVWAIINGEKRSGVTLFRLDSGVDDGDIISQESFDIGATETIKDVYAKATVASKNILLRALQNIESVTFKPQNKSLIKVYPQRKPSDGLIDLTRPANEIFDFIRAQSSPYPGAYLMSGDGKKVIIENCRIEEAK